MFNSFQLCQSVSSNIKHVQLLTAADKCLIAKSFSCSKPQKESACRVLSLARVKSNCSNDDRPETSMYGCYMNITMCHCMAARSLCRTMQNCSLTNTAQSFLPSKSLGGRWIKLLFANDRRCTCPSLLKAFGSTAVIVFAARFT